MLSLAKWLRRLARGLLRAPLFTSVAVVTLAVGIGANTAIFTLVYGILLKPLPFDEPDRLVAVWHKAPGLGFDQLNMSPSTYLTYREQSRAFEAIGLWDNAAASITGVGEPERVATLRVTEELLPVLRVEPLIGQRFGPRDGLPGSPERVLLSHGFWQRKFAGDPGVIGQPLLVDGEPWEIIGVLPPDFRFLREDPALVMPLAFVREEVFAGQFSYQGIARLRPGASVAQANDDVARMIPASIDDYRLPPGFSRAMFEDAGLGPLVRPLPVDVIGDVGGVLWVLLGTVGLVLLIACANVANLFLVRAEGRQRELAVRSALGASWGQNTRELLGESTAIALVGGVLGLALAEAALRVLLILRPQGLPRLDELAIDPIVMAFALAISLVAGLLFGLLPVLRFSNPRLASALQEGGRSSSDGRERHRARSALIAAEIALAVVLLVAAGLMIRTFQAMRDVDPGFVRAEEVLTARIAIPEGVVPGAEETVLMHEQLAEAIARVPGVTSVGGSSSITMDGSTSMDPIFVEVQPTADGQLPPIRRFKWVGGNYFETMGIRLVAGRTLTWADAHQTLRVAVVTENFTREYWDDPPAALGKRIRQTPDSPWREIVGVVGNVRDDGVDQPAPAVVYWPMHQLNWWDDQRALHRMLRYVVRSDRLGSPTFLGEIQRAVWDLNPNLPVANVQPLARIYDRSMAQTSFALVLLAIAAGVAVLLSVVGIYGVIAYVASQRTREIGIRMALGAQTTDVTQLFLRHGLALTAVGVVLGLVGAVALTRLMSAMLFGVSAVDPTTYVAAAVGLGLTALLATYIPARRAANVDPAVTLRADL
ncbi:MAG: ABC transporter permease [Dehalococcoidia bacterium]|jgi:predicted permease|nr:ABC transporter permease [Dehalococcoidia bacterium]